MGAVEANAVLAAADNAATSESLEVEATEVGGLVKVYVVALKWWVKALVADV